MTEFFPNLRRVYWETTAGCNLRCRHCRRIDVLDQASPQELNTLEGKVLLDDLKAMGRPVIIFSGGEPLTRPDFFELAAYAKQLGLPAALATNGTLITETTAQRVRESGIYYASISLDGATAETHDQFRGTGSFEKALRGMDLLHQAGIKVQVNFTVMRNNMEEIPEIYELAWQHDAIALYLFLLVPVGCGVEIAPSQMLNAMEVEKWMMWVCEKDQAGPLPLKAICAPQVFRVKEQFFNAPMTTERKGCLAGIHMCFVSHKGQVFPCGYLPISAGNVRHQSFREIWNESALFKRFRDPDLLHGRCGACEFKGVCGGCRARAYHAYGDILGEEPFCSHTPARMDPAQAAG